MLQSYSFRLFSTRCSKPASSHNVSPFGGESTHTFLWRCQQLTAILQKEKNRQSPHPSACQFCSWFCVLIVHHTLSFSQEISRPPFVDSRDVKRMLACPAEEMHIFSDPKKYRTRPRYTRLALPFREIEEAIQVMIICTSVLLYIGICRLPKIDVHLLLNEPV